jgi:hypothetical protein
MSKGTAFIAGLSCVMVVFFCLLVTHTDPKDIPVGAIVAGIVSSTTCYIGLQVTNNGVIGKFYRPELDDRNKNEVNKSDAVCAKEDADAVCAKKDEIVA